MTSANVPNAIKVLLLIDFSCLTEYSFFAEYSTIKFINVYIGKDVKGITKLYVLILAAVWQPENFISEKNT